ncbi:MAG: peptidase M3, partial [Bacteroidaceae bacterium]|nr:peptidase M3 [Bacteroidaceae bacterium]
MTETQNPFLTAYHTPHETVPFHLIRLEHYEPAILKGMEEQNREIETIVNNPEEPTFQNTIVALERSGDLLNRVSTVFGNLLSAETNDEMDALAEKVMPMLTEHSNNITLNEALFARIHKVYASDHSTLSVEENRLLENTYQSFIRSGANLAEKDKETFRQISASLSLNSLKFSQNLLKENNGYELVLTEEQLTGLPDSAIEAYAQTAKEKGKEGYVVTLSIPSFGPFMKYSTHRELRKELYTAYHTQCTHDNEYNNLDIVKTLVNLRQQRAQLLGAPTVADFVL